MIELIQEADTEREEKIKNIISDKVRYIGEDIQMRELVSIKRNFKKFNKIFMHTKKKVEAKSPTHKLSLLEFQRNKYISNFKRQKTQEQAYKASLK